MSLVYRASALAGLLLAGCGAESHGPDADSADAGMNDAAAPVDSGPDPVCAAGSAWARALEPGNVGELAIGGPDRLYTVARGVGPRALDSSGETLWELPIAVSGAREPRIATTDRDLVVLADLPGPRTLGGATFGPGTVALFVTPGGAVRASVPVEGAPLAVAATPAGEVFVLRDRLEGREMIAIAPDGATRWVTRLADADEVDPAMAHVAVGPAGAPFVAWPGLVAGLAPDGAITWRGPAPAREVHDLVVSDGGDDVALVGVFMGSADFGGGDLGPTMQFDAFVAVLDAGGAHRWSRALRSAAFDYAYGAAFQPDGSLLATGHFGEGGAGRSELEVGGDTTLVSESNDRDLFVASFAPDGAPRFVLGARDTGQAAGRAIAAHPCGGFVLAGLFGPSLSIEGLTLESGEAFHPFLWRSLDDP